MDILERRQEIAANPDASARELAERFGVSESTVYRDRQWLAMTGDNGTEQFAATPDVTSGLQFSRFKQISTSGVEFHGGQVTEEFQRELQDDGGVKLYTEMSMHPVTSAVLFAIEMAIRQVEWMAEPASDKPADKKKAEFLDECREDMSQTWDDIVGQSVRPTLIYGFNLAELVYKKRLGMKPPAYVKDPGKSRYNDGLIGWRRWQFISPRSMPAGNRWQFDENGRVQAFRQQPAPDYQMRTIPMGKALLFRSSMLWDNPEPPGILRYMYRAWYYATNMQEIEAIGAERLGVGLPLIYLGDGCSMEGANSDYQQALDIVRNVRADEQMGVVIPKPKILADGRGMLFELASPPSQGLVDFNKVIERYENRMAMTVLAQFIFNGMLQVGSYALNRSATDTFQMSVGAWAGMVADVINRFAVPRLFALNDKFGVEDLPQLTHTEVGVPDLVGVADFVNKLVQSQALTVDDELEKYLRELARFPEMQEKEIEITPEKAAAETEEETEEEEAPEVAEGETPEGGEGKTPEVEITEEASESFALKTIRGALARESTTGKFARGGGQPLSDEEVALGDAVAFGKMTASQAKMLAGAGLLNLSGGAYKYTEKGRSLSRLMRREPRKGMDQLTALTKGKGIMVKLPKKGGGGKGKKAAGEQQAVNREKVLGALADKGVDAAQIDALAALKEGGEADADALAGMEEAGLVKTAEDGTVIMTSAGRSLLGAANGGDVDRARAAMVNAAEAKKRAAERAAKGAGKEKAGKTPEKEEKKPEKPTAAGRLEQAGLKGDAAKAFTLALGSADPDKAASAQDEEARAALVELGLFEELEEGGATVSAKGRELWRAMENGDWDKVEELLGEEMGDTFFEAFGGPGSGHWGHKGTPGRGGSAPGGGLALIGAKSGHSRFDRIALSQKYRVERESEAKGEAGSLRFQPSDRAKEKATSIAREDIKKYADEHGISETEALTKLESRLNEIKDQPISTRRGLRGSTDVVENGRFKTSYEVEGSGNILDGDWRAEAERQGLGVPTDIDLQQRPIYGYVPGVVDSRVHGYGPVEFHLKKSVNSRATVTVGDSLGDFHSGYTVGSSIKNPGIESVNQRVSNFLDSPQRIEYIEAQITGGLSLADIERVTIHRGGLSGPNQARPDFEGLIDVLKNKGIEVHYDIKTP